MIRPAQLQAAKTPMIPLHPPSSLQAVEFALGIHSMTLIEMCTDKMERLKKRLGSMHTPEMTTDQMYGGDSYQPAYQDKLNQLFPSPPTMIPHPLQRQHLLRTATEAQVTNRSLSVVLKEDHPEQYVRCKIQVIQSHLTTIKERREEIQRAISSLVEEDRVLKIKASKIADELLALGSGIRVNLRKFNALFNPTKSGTPQLTPCKPKTPPTLLSPYKGDGWRRIPVVTIDSGRNWTDWSTAFSRCVAGKLT